MGAYRKLKVGPRCNIKREAKIGDLVEYMVLGKLGIVLEAPKSGRLLYVQWQTGEKDWYAFAKLNFVNHAL